MSEAEDDGPRGGKRNAIVTYETVSAIENGVSILNTKMDAVVAALRDASDDHKDHEVRIRSLELSLAAAMAAKGTVGQVASGLIALVSIGIAVLAYLRP